MSDYKTRHEQFVTGLTGGPVSEIYLVSLASIVGGLTWAALQSRTDVFRDSHRWSVTGLALDFALNWATVLLAMTVYASMPGLLIGLVGGPGLALVLFKKTVSNRVATRHGPGHHARLEYLPRRPVLTFYRAIMMINTCVAILAVDFVDFPRRFAKVETWGTSLMDLGVGSFVFSMGLVSARNTLKDVYEQVTAPLSTRLLRAGRQTLSVLVLGLIRLLLVKAVDYHEHVSEYGVHWNFFMTLGLLPVFVTVLDSISVRRIPTCLVALAVVVIYQLVLDYGGLQVYILTAPRTNLLAQNKEGVFSFIGYLSIFLSGRSCGYFLLPQQVSWRSVFYPQTRDEVKRIKGKTLARSSQDGLLPGAVLLAYALAYHLLLQLCSIAPSRRLANLPYVLWTVSYNMMFLGLLVLAQNLLFSGTWFDYELMVSQGHEAINSNGLLVFLVANLLTGLVNMVFNTLDASTPQAMALLSGYMLVLYVFCIVLYRLGVKIKL